MHHRLARPARGRAFATLATLAVLASASAPIAGAQSAPRVGTVIVAHGGGPEWNVQVRDVAKIVRTGGPVEVSFLMGSEARTTRFQDAVAKLEAQGASEIVVVPMLVSSHSGHYNQLRYLAGELDSLGHTMMHHLHMSGIERAAPQVPVRLAKAMDDSPEIGRVLAARARALAAAPAEQALFIIGHGPNSAEDNAEWMRNLRRIADSVRVSSGFRDVKLGLVRDDAPAPVRAEAVQGIREMIEVQHALTQREVVVVPVLVSTGSVSREKLPKDLSGLPVVYDGTALLPHEEMARWVERRVREATQGVTSRTR